MPDSVIPAAYAYILTHPGFPCVAWQHYFSYAESGSNLSAGGTQFISGNSAGTVNGSSGTLRELIDTLIDLRKSLGIEYDSSKEILSSSSSCYAARVDGLNGSFIVSIGTSTYSGDVSDYEVIASGTFEWKAIVGTYTLGETAPVTGNSWTWQGDPNNSYPGTTSITW